MAQRTGAGDWLSLASISCLPTGFDAEEHPSIPASASRLSRNCAERAKKSTLVFETLAQHRHDNLPSAIHPAQLATRMRQTRRAAPLRCGSLGRYPTWWDHHTQVGVLCNLERSLPHTLWQIALLQHLKAPSDPSHQVLFVSAIARLSEHFFVPR